MAQKKYKNKKLFQSRNPRRTLGLLVFSVLALGVIYFVGTSSYKADTTTAAANNCQRGIVQNVKKNMGINTDCPARGSKLTVEVEKPFPNSNVSAFPDGKSCAYVNIEAIKADGTFLENEPLVIDKPSSVNISGPTTTDSGSIKWCLTTKRPIQARITVKLKSLPQVQRSFQVNFNPQYKLLDITDRNAFYFNLPVDFMAQIDPSTVSGIKSAQLVYTYNRRVNKWGKWKTERREISAPLKCSEDGRCEATIYPDNTNTKRVDRGTFNYRFNIVYNNGTKSTKSFTGRLIIP